jgi:hypothetical protein
VRERVREKEKVGWRAVRDTTLNGESRKKFSHVLNVPSQWQLVLLVKLLYVRDRVNL